MPLLDKDFDQKFVCAREEDTVGAVLEALKAQDGQDTWHIFVARGAEFGVVQVGRLRDLLPKLGGTLFDLTFGQLQAYITPARQVQQEAIGIGSAERLALKSPARVLMVMREDEVAGRLFLGTMRGGDVFPASTMGQLYGDYMDTHPDARSRWRPAGLEPPTCPHCGYQAFFHYRVDDGEFYCGKCDKTVSGGD
jgi:ribosomal protein L37AE/L43A